MNHLRAITLIALIPLALFTVPRAAHPASAQTAAVDVQSASQLQLADSVFPSDYTSAGSQAVAAADGDNSDFSFFHVNSYSALGVGPSSSEATAGSRSSSTVRSTERTAKLSSSSRFAFSSSNEANAELSREHEEGPSPRCRAIEIAEETLWVSARAIRRE